MTRLLNRRPASSDSCSWCHTMNPESERYCRRCAHEAHRLRSECECPSCRVEMAERTLKAVLAAAPRATGTLLPHSPRYNSWKVVFESDTVPLVSATPHWGNHPETGTVLFFMLDAAALSREARARLIGYLSEKFGVPRAEVEQDVRGEHGVPILSDDMLVRGRGSNFI